MFAAVGSFPYKVALLLHLLAAFVAFAPAFVWPILKVTMRKEGNDIPPAVLRHLTPNDMRVHVPALILTALFGVSLVLLSDDVWEFSQVWISIAFVLWFLMLGILFLGLLPAQRTAATAPDTPGIDSRLSMFGGMLHLLFFLMLIVMIWKPGWP